jgi:hypothetical protein
LNWQRSRHIKPADSRYDCGTFGGQVIANVVIGGFRASNLLNSGAVAALIGALAGLSEKALPAAMMQRASSFISSGHHDK